MIDDLRSVLDGTAFPCDLCVIGAGAAGIAIARRFAGHRASVVVLESGGFELESATQQLYDFENVGLPRSPLTRLRYFGGTTGEWDNRCAPLSASDFAPRPWIDHSGWPLSLDELEPYYAAAHDVCGLKLNVYDESLPAILDARMPSLDGSKLRNQFWQFSPGPPVRFGTAYRQELAASTTVRVLLHANATNIQVTPNGTAVEHVEARTLEGVTVRIRPRFVVLCCGGIENARLLLLSNRVEPQGLGNRRDLVGRYFMEHPRTECGVVAARDPYWLETTYSGYWRPPPDGAHFLAGVALSPAAQAREEVLSCAAVFNYDEPFSGTEALRRLFHRASGGDSTAQDIARDVWRAMDDLGEVVINARRKFLLPGRDIYRRPQAITMTCDVEQAPNPDSRVTLSSERDALGQPRARIDWRITDLERRTVQALATAIGEEFGRLNVGRVKLPEWLIDRHAPAAFREVHHHMGTTRMAPGPESGVVSRDSQVFGIANLYVAGSSVFPTGGHVNPTLTIVALSLRLADHLASQL